jgi:outer membrane protein OmpA-like peptidoglycan-associated protein
MDPRGLNNRQATSPLLSTLVAIGLTFLLTDCGKEPAATAIAVAPATGAPGPVRMYFDVESAAPAADASAQLNGVVAYAKAHRESRVTVAGYSDPSAAAPANEEMARNRALAIRNVLVGNGVDEIQVDFDQIATGRNGEREARVEVSIR